MNTNTLLNAFSQFRGISSKPVSMATAKTVCIAGRDTLNLGAKACVVVVKTGVAWVTADGIDHLVAAGQTLALPALTHPAIASSAGQSGVLIEIRR